MTVERGKDSNPPVVEVSRRKMRDLGALGFGDARENRRDRVKLSETLRNRDDVMSQHRFATTRLQ